MRTALLVVALLFCLALVSGQLDIKIGLYRADPPVVNFTISNPYPVPHVFLAWGTPFEGVWTDMFDIRDEQNNRVDYIGMLVRRGEKPIDEEYITVPAGGHLSVTVDLADNYEFLSVGKYVVRLDLPLCSDLHYILNENHIVSLSLNTLPPLKTFFHPDGFTNCNANQISQTNTAINGAWSESNRARNCLNGGTCESQSTLWFGTYSASNRQFTTSCFNAVYNRLNNAEFNGYCNPAGCGSNVYGYVYPTDSTFTVYMCNLFWTIPNERVNTIVHEMSHFRSLGGTNDYAYGKPNCQALARNNPNQASRNADNICYFSESA